MIKNDFLDSQVFEFIHWSDRPCYIIDEAGNVLFSNTLADLVRKRFSLSEQSLLSEIAPLKGKLIYKYNINMEYAALFREINIYDNKLTHVTLHNLNENIDALEVDDKMECLINSLQEGVYITDGEGFTKRINNAYTELTELNKEDVEGKHVAELVSKGIFDSSVTAKVMSTKGNSSNMQKINNNKICLVTGVPVFDGCRNLIAVINSAYDLTEMNYLQDSVKKNEITLKRKDIEIERLKARVEKPKSGVTRSAIMEGVNEISKKLSESDVPVLLLGDTGTGKSTMAYSIHKMSQRSGQPLIEVNCGAIPESLFESELFGYAKGAFTGASDSGKVGLIESADQGTLFLDEVGDMPTLLQVKLLTFLQTGKIRRLGENDERKIDVRIISATNKNPDELIKYGVLREDLFYRLSLVSLTLPSLKERKEDIFFLTKNILDSINSRYKKNIRISKDAFLFLESYEWPGNLRELEHVIEQMVVLLDGSVIRTENLPDKVSSSRLKVSDNPFELNLTLQEYMDTHEKEFLLLAIKNEPDIGRLSSALGIHRTTLTRKLKRHELI